MSPSSVFPPEIYDKIIDEVSSSSSKDNLSACSLVDRSWISRSRAHMFRDINFTTASKKDLPTSIKHTVAFQQNVASNTDVALYARHLVLTLTSSGNTASQIPQASQLLNLHSITLKCSNSIIYAVNDAVLTRLLSFIRHNQNLEHISVQSLVIEPSAFDVFIKCIGIRAPRLRSLHLQSVWGPDWTTDVWNQRKSAQRSESHHKVHALTKLFISHCEDGLISTFIGAFDLRYLERIALTNLDWGSCMTIIAATLNSTSLNHFTLDLSDHRRFSINGSGEDIYTRLASIPTVQLILQRFSDAPSTLQRLQRAAFQRQHFLKQLHLQFRQYPSPSEPVIDTAFREFQYSFPRLRVSIGFDIQEGISSTSAATMNTSALFRRMGQIGGLQFESLDAWWTHEAERY
ncbi:hypothetical protein DFH05DRAFT_1529118 [Lentinula detonsa]|uniref:Uncharacterized protein n=3 Tax=Lentinula TaxID=5352 RepID=A0A9W8NTJ4_9AGAR|nr:hypothetical protein DFH05DRAFT_1529118 [Lentinula detonsa]